MDTGNGQAVHLCHCVQPQRQLSKSAAPEFPQLLGITLNRPLAADLGSLPLALNPRTLLFGEMPGMTLGSPSGNGYSHAAVRTNPNDVTPRPRMADIIKIATNSAHP